jgi:hypothetical protein
MFVIINNINYKVVNDYDTNYNIEIILKEIIILKIILILRKINFKPNNIIRRFRFDESNN